MFHLDVQVPRLNAREKLSSRHVLGVTDIRGDHNCPEKIRGHWKWITEWWMGSLCPDKNRPMQMVNAIRATCPGSAVPFLLRQVREEGFQSSPVPWKWLNYFSHYSKCLQLFISETEGLRGTFLSSWEHVSKVDGDLGWSASCSRALWQNFCARSYLWESAAFRIRFEKKKEFLTHL